ncbi:MAG: HD domain-containing protein, partial [Nanoarchaeota archaeon]
MEFNEESENKLKETVFKYLEHGRPNWDIPHTLTAVHWAKELLKYEPGNPKIVIPAVYLHDIGNSNLFKDSEYNLKLNRSKKQMHMKMGAEIAKKILTENGEFSEEEIQEISNIISIHDVIKKIKTSHEQLVFEADRLAQVDVERVKPTFSKEDYIFFLYEFEKDIVPVFKTKTGEKFINELLNPAKKYSEQMSGVYVDRFQKYFQKQIIKIENLEHKGNNKLFKISLDKRKNKNFILKEYSTVQTDGWDRGKTEFGFISYFWKRGLRNIPEPIVYDENEHIGVYSFVKGKKLASKELKKEDIIEIANFLSKVYQAPAEDKKKFGLAKEACLTLNDYIKIIDNRITNIINYSPSGKNGRRARDFLDREIIPLAEKIKQDFYRNSLNFNEELSIDEQVIIPGDFGFHNCLVSPKGHFLLDFEYSGRDDPIRQVSHFI